MKAPICIGLAGPSGAGKTTLAHLITNKYPHITHIKQDDFFKNISEFPRYREWVNREVPENLYWDEFFAAMLSLKRGVPTVIPQYHRESDQRIGTRVVTPTDVILVEGYLLFFDPRIRNLLDVRLYVHVSTEQQYARKKGRWPEMDDRYFYEVVVPMFEMHGSHGARFAHAILNGDATEHEIVCEFERCAAVSDILARVGAPVLH